MCGNPQGSNLAASGVLVCVWGGGEEGGDAKGGRFAFWL